MKRLLALAIFIAAVPLIAAEPYLVKDINANLAPRGSYPAHFQAMGNLMFFSTSSQDSSFAYDLWRSDGTAGGTFALGSGGYEKAVYNGRLYYLSAAPQVLWSTDGTVAGTVPFPWPANVLQPTSLFTGPGYLFMTAAGGKLWRTDGTAGGTEQVAPWMPFATATVGSTLYALADSNANNTRELWRIDGLTRTMLKDFGSSGSPQTLHVAGSTVYAVNMVVVDGGLVRTELWRSDGTAGGTYALKSSTNALIELKVWRNLAAAGSTLYFLAKDGGVVKLWKTDGSAPNTVVAASTMPGAASSFENADLLGVLPSGRVLLSGPRLGASASSSFNALWSFDGTNTTFLTDTGQLFPDYVAMADTYAALFTNGTLYRTDGTIGGTVTLTTFAGNPNPYAPPFDTVGDSVFFPGTNGYGTELWKSDGTPGGTTMLKDLVVATYDSEPRTLAPVRGGVVFTASSDDVDADAETRDLWFSDGTEGGTQVLMANVGANVSAGSCGGRVFFTRWSVNGLWITDGTGPGTGLLHGNVLADSFACLDEVAYFGTPSGLWRSDGNGPGTLHVRNVPLASHLYVHGKHVFFLSGSSNSVELWRSDGTPGGTVLLKQFGPGSAPFLPGGAKEMISSGPYLYFITGSSEAKLWRTDGTAEGTVQVVGGEALRLHDDFNGRLAFAWSTTAGPRGSCTTNGTEGGTTCFDSRFTDAYNDEFIVTLNDRLYFKPGGHELFESDGDTTSSSTGINSVGALRAVAGGRLYTNGYSWRAFRESDGMPAGTRVLLDREVEEAVASGGRLFMATDELYAYDLEVTPTSFTPQTVAPSGGQGVTISGRGFNGPVTITVGGVPASVGSVTATSIELVSPPHDPGSYEVELRFGDGRRMTLDEPLVYACVTPTAAVGTPAQACPMVPVTLQGSGGTRCAWFPAAGLSDASSCTPTATVAQPTDYTLIVFNEDGCPSNNYPMVTVTPFPLPSAEITYPAGEIYSNTSHTASVPDAGPDATYTWSVKFGASIKAGTGNMRTVTFSTGCDRVFELAVTVTTAGGCTASSRKSRFLTSSTLTGSSHLLPHPGTVVTLTGTGLSCINQVRIAWDGGGQNFTPTVVDANTLRFTYGFGLRPGRATASRIGDALPGATLSPFLFPAARRSFDDNSRSDVFWRNGATGETSTWLMSSLTFSGLVSPPVPLSWSPVAFGDFDGNGRSDIFWHNPSTGETSIWLMNGANPTTTVRSITVPTSWKPSGSGDLNGDGRYDLFWHNPNSGETSIWYMNGTAVTAVRSQTVPAPWAPVAFAHFDSDHYADIFWRNQSTGQTLIWLMTKDSVLPASTVASDTFAPPWIVAGTGNFDSDPREEIFWRNPVTGENAIWYMQGTAIAGKTTVYQVPTSWHPLFADMNGDTLVDLFWHNRTTGETSLWFMNGGVASTHRGFSVTNTNWRPVP